MVPYAKQGKMKGRRDWEEMEGWEKEGRGREGDEKGDVGGREYREWEDRGKGRRSVLANKNLQLKTHSWYVLRLC